jgi:LysR family transcriptional regulator, low CO2-responsive transcriptional regulator
VKSIQHNKGWIVDEPPLIASLAQGLLARDAVSIMSKIHDRPKDLTDTLVIDPGIVDSKRLQMFYASVKEGSFAGAAQMLSVSPSAISHAMKALEEDLGCALFRRFGPQVKPTGAAVRLLPMVEDLLVRMSSMKSELASLDGRHEKLAFRLPASLAGMLPPGVLSTFIECFPAADFQIVVKEDGLSVGTGEGLDFEIDYVDRVPRDVVRRDLLVEQFSAYVAPFHELGQKSRISHADLARCLLVFPDRLTQDWLLPQMERGLVKLRKSILPGPDASRELARQGQGVVFLPGWAGGSAVRDGSLVCLKLQGLEFRRTCCAWWSPNRPLTWVAEVFLSLLAAKTGVQAEAE